MDGFFDLGDDGFSEEEFVRFHISGLKQAAKDEDARIRDWLREYLKEVPDSLEVRELKRLLQ